MVLVLKMLKPRLGDINLCVHALVIDILLVIQFLKKQKIIVCIINNTENHCFVIVYLLHLKYLPLLLSYY